MSNDVVGSELKQCYVTGINNKGVLMPYYDFEFYEDKEDS